MIIETKALLGILCVITALFLMLQTDRYKSWPIPTFNKVVLSVFFVIRIGLYVAIFHLLGFQPRSDVVVYYQEARQVLAGKLPLVEIQTAYGPLFDCICALIVAGWNSSKAIVLFSTIVELAAFPMWLSVGRVAAFEEITIRRAAILYVFNPVAICSVVIDGQNQIWLSLLLALSLLAISSRHRVLSGIYLGLSVVAVKFLSLLFAPILFLLARKSAKWLVPFFLIPIIGYGAVWMLGGHPLNQVLAQANDHSSGNLPYLLTAAGISVTSAGQSLVFSIMIFSILCGFVLYCWLSFDLSDMRQAIIICGMLLLIVMIMSKKAYDDYLVIALFPICLSIAAHRRLLPAALLSGTSALASIEPSMWFRWLHEGQLNLVFAQQLPVGITRGHVCLLFACDLFLVAGYLGLFALSFSTLRDDIRHDIEEAVEAIPGEEGGHSEC